MSFDLAKTSTLQAVTHADEHALADDLNQRVAESVAQAEGTAEATDAEDERAIAQQHLEKARRAERALSALARSLNAETAAATKAAVGALIESVAGGEKPKFKLAGLATLASQGRLVTRAIEELIEQRIPLAQIAHLRAESHALLARSRTLEQVAQDRAEKLLEQLQHAVTEEVVLPVDLSKGVAGALLGQAADLKRRAVLTSADADRLEDAYQKGTKQ
jgi:hypothetical protein